MPPAFRTASSMSMHLGSRRALQSCAIDPAESMLQDRGFAVAVNGTSVPLSFVIGMTFRLTIAFASFGLFVPLDHFRRPGPR